MKGSTTQPKIFISYSWSSLKHEQWVLGLAERLAGDGIHVVLDKWDLKEGQDKHVFMEQMVNELSIQKVLIICDSIYQKKADGRAGGVGTETQLISKEVYENTGQDKFIPVVSERDKNGEPCVPHYIGNRIYIDLSSDDVFEENYQKLVRNLYDKPLVKRPTLGIAPAYITNEEQIVLKTSHKVAEIKNAVLNDKKSINGLITDYFDSFILSLEDFRLTSNASIDGFDEDVILSIEKTIPLRDDFIDFVFTVFKYQESVNMDQFNDFFEKLIPFTFAREDGHPSTESDFDNYRFFFYEIVLNFVAILLHLKKYSELSYFINSQYFYKKTHREESLNTGIEVFNRYLRTLDEFRKNRLKQNRISITADLLKERSIRKDVTFTEIRQADLVLYYILDLMTTREWGTAWFPRTSVYNNHSGSRVEFFDRMISLQFFNKVKNLFGVNNVAELNKLITQHVEKNKDKSKHSSWDFPIKELENVIDITKIGTMK